MLKMLKVKSKNLENLRINLKARKSKKKQGMD